MAVMVEQVEQQAQHMLALSKANRVRLARAAIKREIAEGTKSVAEVVVECPFGSETMPVMDLLMSQHRWGRTRTRRFLMTIPMSETRQVGQLTPRQRMALVAHLQGGQIPDPFRPDLTYPSS